MSQEKKEKEKFQDPALFTNPVRLPWGAVLEGPPMLPLDRQPEHAISDIHPEDLQNRTSGGALPLSCSEEKEMRNLLEQCKVAGASSLDDAQRKRLQWLLSRPEQSTVDPKHILSKRGKVTFT
jgi:hypothetical protein